MLEFDDLKAFDDLMYWKRSHEGLVNNSFDGLFDRMLKAYSIVSSMDC